MIVSLALFLSFVSVQEPKSIWIELNLKRTGANGYEDYLDAFDLYRSGDLEPIVRARFGNRLQVRSDLEYCRIIETKAEPIIAKIRIGNQKEVFDPMPEKEFEETDPRMFMPNQFAKTIHSSASSKFARGATSAAVEDLVTGIQFCENFGRSSTTHYFGNMACSMIFVDSIWDHFEQLSLPDAIRLERVANQCISTPDTLIVNARKDVVRDNKFLREKFAKMTIKEVTKHFSFDDGDIYEGKEAFLAHWETLNKEQRMRAIDVVAKEIERRTDLALATLTGPEKQWKAPEIRKLNETESLLFDAMSGDLLDSIMDTWAEHRTRMRLLKLHAIIRQFRFENDRLPKTLVELSRPKDIHDPLTGDEYIYRPLVNWRYELFSSGSAATGRIDLTKRLFGCGE